MLLIIVVVFGQVIGFEFVDIDDQVYINNFMVIKGLTLEGLSLGVCEHPHQFLHDPQLDFPTWRTWSCSASILPGII